MINKNDRLYQVNIVHPKQRIRVSQFINNNNNLSTYAVPFVMLDNFIYLYQCHNTFMVVELQ
nr:MAG TPA: hypothetical protein [Caudoviricetes sp.]